MDPSDAEADPVPNALMLSELQSIRRTLTEMHAIQEGHAKRLGLMAYLVSGALLVYLGLLLVMGLNGFR